MSPERVVLPPFTDAHVHVGLADPVALRAGGVARAVDLGWDPAIVRTWRSASAGGADPDASAWPSLAVAGGLLGAPGGYPSRAGWAPAAAAIAVADAAGGREAVLAMAALGARVVKVTMNADAGPVWDDALLAQVVEIAHDAGLPVAAHVQGIGQVARAADAGVDVFAHTPWSERLPDALVDRLAATTTWISTLDIHGYGRRGRTFRVALDNLARFHGAGGDVRYGTDLGNGPLPQGLNPRELTALADAGLSPSEIVDALTTGTRARWDPFSGVSDGMASVLPSPMPAGDRTAETVRWLCSATTTDRSSP